MPSHGCVDATATLKTALQSLKDCHQDAYVLFVDLVKAFDSVILEMLWQIVAKFTILVPIVDVIMKMYTEIEVSTSVGKAKATFPATS
jgi:Holliday junction resolvasome RuvABC ATP-dependent DNA helicase subunit